MTTFHFGRFLAGVLQVFRRAFGHVDASLLESERRRALGPAIDVQAMSLPAAVYGCGEAVRRAIKRGNGDQRWGVLTLCTSYGESAIFICPVSSPHERDTACRGAARGGARAARARDRVGILTKAGSRYPKPASRDSCQRRAVRTCSSDEKTKRSCRGARSDGPPASSMGTPRRSGGEIQARGVLDRFTGEHVRGVPTRG